MAQLLKSKRTYARVQVAKLQKKVAEAVKAHKAEEAKAEAKRKEHAGAQKTALQLDKKAGKRQRDADAAVSLQQFGTCLCERSKDKQFFDVII